MRVLAVLAIAALVPAAVLAQSAGEVERCFQNPAACSQGGGAAAQAPAPPPAPSGGGGNTAARPAAPAPDYTTVLRSPEPDRRKIQESLRTLDKYNGPIDGNLQSDATVKAIQEWQKGRGTNPVGKLTPQEAQQLNAEAARTPIRRVDPSTQTATAPAAPTPLQPPAKSNADALKELQARLAERRKARGKPGALTCVDKANVFKAFAFFRGIFDEIAKKHPEVKTDRLYVDACSAMLVKRPWDFDVMVMENMFGDIVSDITASLIGGLGMAPSADIGDKYAVFQPCHGTAPDIMGQGKANPTGMILSAAMMLDWLADKHGVESAAEAGETIERAVDKIYAAGIKPMEFGGSNGTADIAKAVLGAL